METDCIHAHGSPSVACDRLMEQSDEYKMWFCDVCGLQALAVNADPETGAPARRECTVCGSSKVSLVRLPYATKLLMQVFGGLHVMTRVMTTPYE